MSMKSRAIFIAERWMPRHLRMKLIGAEWQEHLTMSVYNGLKEFEKALQRRRRRSAASSLSPGRSTRASAGRTVRRAS